MDDNRILFVDLDGTLIKEDLSDMAFLYCFKNDYATDTLAKMKKNKINSLPVLDKNKKIIGAINMHILVNSGI